MSLFDLTSSPELVREPVVVDEPGVDEYGVEAVAAAEAERPTVVVVRSKKRKRSVQARWDGDQIKVMMPAWMSKADEKTYVEELVTKLLRQRVSDGVDLPERAATLAARYGLEPPQSIRWVNNQRSRWGSCTPATGEIRLSNRMAAFPQWVLDYVIVHELAHLTEANHSARFWKLVNRYPKVERATGYLMAKSEEGDNWCASR